jgi:uncharacterized membrane protein
MAAGYAFGPLLVGEPAARDRRLAAIGLGVTLGFVVLRATNGYGDPTPWTSRTPCCRSSTPRSIRRRCCSS